jgi:hypothetical protein
MKLIASSLISLSVLVGIVAPASAVEDANEKNRVAVEDANDKRKVAIQNANDKKSIQGANERLNSRAFNPQPDPPGKVALKRKSHESNPIGTKRPQKH